jgi:hypothetical protein
MLIKVEIQIRLFRILITIYLTRFGAHCAGYFVPAHEMSKAQQKVTQYIADGMGRQAVGSAVLVNGSAVGHYLFPYAALVRPEATAYKIVK